MNTIGCKICSLRKQSKMSQEQLAERLRVSRQSVSKWERDEALPDIYNLETISNIFGVTIDSLIKSDELTTTTTAHESPLLPFLKKKSIKTIIIIVTCLAVFFGVLSYLIFYSGYYDFNEGSYLGKIFISLIISLAPALIIYRGILKDRLKKYNPSNQDNISKNKLTIVNSTITHIFISIFLISVLVVNQLMRLPFMLPHVFLVIILCAIITRNINPQKNQINSVHPEIIKLPTNTAIKINEFYKKADILLISSITLCFTSFILYVSSFCNLDYNPIYYLTASNSQYEDIYPDYTRYYIILAGLFVIVITMLIIQYILRRRIKKEYYKESIIHKKSKENYFFIIFAPLAVIVVLISGFVYSTWHPTWVILPVSGLLAMIINHIKTKETGTKSDEQQDATISK